jgi:hypothetical protein
MGNLKEYPRAVTRIFLRPLSATMLEVYQHAERVVHHAVGALSFEVRQGTDAARVVLELGVIESCIHRFPSHI